MALWSHKVNSLLLPLEFPFKNLDQLSPESSSPFLSDQVIDIPAAEPSSPPGPGSRYGEGTGRPREAATPSLFHVDLEALCCSDRMWGRCWSKHPLLENSHHEAALAECNGSRSYFSSVHTCFRNRIWSLDLSLLKFIIILSSLALVSLLKNIFVRSSFTLCPQSVLQLLARYLQETKRYLIRNWKDCVSDTIIIVGAFNKYVGKKEEKDTIKGRREENREEGRKTI